MNESTQAEGLRTIPLSLIELNEGQLAGLPQNPRSIKKGKYDKLKKSITDYPEMLKYRSLLVYPLDNGHFITIGGNMRFRAMQELGYAEAPCIVIPKETSVDRLQAYTIQDNNEFGEWDWDLLANEWDNELLDEWGLDVWQYEDEKKKMENPDTEEAEINEEDAITRVQKGDIWQLGEHRLMCGDSTDVAMVALLMKGERADLCFTSPPYNMKWDNDIQVFSKSHGKMENVYNRGRTYKEYDDANQTESDYQNLLDKSLGIALEYCDDVMFNIGILSTSRSNVARLLGNYAEYMTEIISWVKSTSMPLGLPTHRGLLSHRSEPIFCFSKTSRAFSHPQWTAGQGYNICETKSASSNEYSKEHHATFPVELPSFFICNFTDKSVLDLFGGTGTTLIAAEQLNRKCYMMELDAHYCDIIIARWEKLTGKQAIRLENHNI